MATNTSSAPPPYVTNVSSSEIALPAGATVIPIPTPNNGIAGVREQILDNAPLLFQLCHGAVLNLPKDFSVCTAKVPLAPKAAAADSGRSNKIYAAIFIHQQSSSKAIVLSLFVQGAQAETSEDALRVLLDKTEAMIGRRWKPSIDRRNFVED